MKGATFHLLYSLLYEGVSIHAPNEGSDFTNTNIIPVSEVSIHAPNEGSDKSEAYEKYTKLMFQSTLPMKGATFAAGNCHFHKIVSIHAPNEGSD